MLGVANSAAAVVATFHVSRLVLFLRLIPTQAAVVFGVADPAPAVVAAFHVSRLVLGLTLAAPRTTAPAGLFLPVFLLAVPGTATAGFFFLLLVATARTASLGTGTAASRRGHLPTPARTGRGTSPSPLFLGVGFLNLHRAVEFLVGQVFDEVQDLIGSPVVLGDFQQFIPVGWIIDSPQVGLQVGR
jgi:hypothetical protein